MATSCGVGYNRGVNNVNYLYKKRIHDYSLMACAKYTYFSDGDYYLYGGGSLGFGFRYIEAHTQIIKRIIPEYELTPIGINLGNGPLSFFVEGIIGSLANGCRIGVNIKL